MSEPLALQSLAELFERMVEETATRAAEMLASRRRLLSKSALAEHYGVSERTIRTWRERGLPGYRVGREVMYPIDECDRWVEAHR